MVLRNVAERMPARPERLHSAHSISKIALHAFMDLTADELARIAELTIGHYNRHAEAYWQGTRDHDVRQNIAALLPNIEARAPFAILDLGCGPGRDLVAFTALGHVAVGVEGAATLAAMARANSGCEVWQQDLLALDLPKQRFDGVFANAVLFHVPSQELSRVLRQLHETLKPGGVLFSSNPHGRNEEGWHGERYGAYHDLQTWRRYLVGDIPCQLRKPRSKVASDS